MNYLGEFKKFYLKVVLPNTQSYKNYFNESNLDQNFDELINNFEQSYGLNPFSISASSQIQGFISQKLEPFYTYSEKKGSNVPQSILNKHYSLFIDYNKKIQFNDLQEVIDELHRLFGTNFISKFQKERINLNGNSRISSTNKIFGNVRDDYWTINKGSERELQFHIYKDSNRIGYGLGFNSQKSQNNLNPIENVFPFINSFFSNKNKLDVLLNDYSFGNRSLQDLKDITEGEFILFGKSFGINFSNNKFELEGLHLLEMYYDLKNKQFDAYKLVFENSKNITTNKTQIFDMMKHEALLQYKKQIILQGPPGTGKTRKAKEICHKMISISEEFITKQIKVGMQINTAKGQVSYKILSANETGFTLEREKGTTNTVTFGSIISAYNGEKWKNEISNNDDRMAVAIAKYLYDNFFKDNEQVKLIQFHPSYTYEDFVRGIVAESKGEKIEYKNVNKTLGLFAEQAFKNFENSKKFPEVISKELWIQKQYLIFKEYLESELLKSGELLIKNDTKPKITAIEDDAIRVNRYSNEDDSVLIKDNDIIYGYIGLHLSETIVKVKDNSALSKSARSGMYYLYQNLIEKFENYLKDKNIFYHPVENAKLEELKNYVLIIDEINRANLSSVLGELIYALEYRGEEVESMYEVDGSQKLILPPNLYIIGTMNTADRSVGNIDYAIRRRFAFVDVLPKELDDDKIVFHKDWFRKVSELFIENYDEYISNDKTILKPAKTLSGEFRPEDVWIGHSYFIQKKLEDESLEPDDFRIRIDYEIKPILLEYAKDGVLTGKVGEITVEDYIKCL